MSTSVAFVDNSGHVLFQEKLSAGNGDALPIYSLAKTFIASAICLSEIDLQAPITTWIDPSLVPDATDITVQHLLNHSSGLIDYGGLSEYQQAVSEAGPPWSDEEFAARTLQQPLLFTPGTRFSYSNPGYWLLKKILEHEHGKSWAVVLTDLITSALQLDDTRVVHGQFAKDLADYPAQWVWHGVITSSALDVARFMASELIEPLRQNLIQVTGQQAPWVDPHYGYGLMVEPGKSYGHNGDGPGYSASCFHFVEHGITGCVLAPDRAQDRLMTIFKDRLHHFQSTSQVSTPT